ncbi:MAG: hypothetical protein F7C32_01605 [Desulfurococcales archaeon]|nr:hypothetical protein [Desulfurococcales archaeon]
MENIPVGGPYKAAMGLHEPLTRDHIRKIQKILFTYCFESDDETECRKMLWVLWEISKLIAKTRTFDLLKQEKREGLESDLYDFMEKLLSFYAKLIAGFYRVSEQGRIFVKIKRTVAHPESNSRLEPGDFTFMRPSNAIILAAAGYVEIVELVSLPAEKH